MESNVIAWYLYVITCSNVLSNLVLSTGHLYFNLILEWYYLNDFWAFSSWGSKLNKNWKAKTGNAIFIQIQVGIIPSLFINSNKFNVASSFHRMTISKPESGREKKIREKWCLKESERKCVCEREGVCERECCVFWPACMCCTSECLSKMVQNGSPLLN